MFTSTTKTNLLIRYSLYSILFVMGLFLLFRQSLRIIEEQFIQESQRRTEFFADYASQRYNDYQVLITEFDALFTRQLIAMGEILLYNFDTYTILDWQRMALEQEIDSIAIADQTG